MSSMEQFSVFAFAAGDPPPKASELIEAARHADQLGFYSISLPHHLTLPASQVYTGFPQRNILDPLALLPAMAAVTSNIRVGTNSAIIPLLPPYVWARYFATLDVLSEGRALAGMAMGWFEKDFDGANVNRRQRARLFDEELEVIKRLWTEDSVTHEGPSCKIRDMELEPKPIQRPHPPIWIGGFLPSIPRTAKYAQYLLPANLTTEEIKEVYLPRLREESQRWGTDAGLCLSVRTHIGNAKGPDPDIITRVKRAANFSQKPDIYLEQIAIVGTPRQCAERILEYQEAGVAHFLLDFQYHGLASVEYSLAQMDRFVEKVVPLLG